MRTVASQMKDAEGRSVTVRLGGAAASGEDVVFSASGRVITFHGFLKAYVEGSDDPDKDSDDRETRLPDVGAGRRGERRGDQRGRPRDQAAGPLHRGHADPRARGARDRPPLDVRLDHRHDPQPRLRLQEGHRAGAGLAGVLGDPAAGGALHPAGELRVHRRHGGRPRRDRRRPARTATPSWPSSTSAAATSRACKQLVSELGDIDARELATFPIAEGIDLRVGRYGPYIETPDGTRANVPDDLPPDELTEEKARELLANPAGEETRARRRTRRPACRSWPRTAATAPTSPSCCPRTPPSRSKPRTGSLFKSMSLDTITLEDALPAAHPPARGRRRPGVGRRDHRAERPLRALPEEGHRLPLDRLRGAAAHDHARGGAGDLRPAQAAWPGGRRPGQGGRRRPGERQPR